jgi:hypothetical protein
MTPRKAVRSPPRTAQRTSRFNLEIIPPATDQFIDATAPIPRLSIRHNMDRIVLPPPTNRKRVLPQGELEAASTLRLGADQHTHTLSLSEARLVIHTVLENKRRGGNKYEEPEYVSFPGYLA